MFAWLSAILKIFSGRNTKKFWLLLLLITFAVICFFTYPLLQNIRALSGAITQQKNELIKKQTPEQALQEILAQYKQEEGKIDLLNRTVLSQSRELEFIMALEDAAERNRVRQKIEWGDAASPATSTIKKIPLRVEVEGLFSDALNYLQAIERLPVYVNIKQLSVSNPKNNSGNVAPATEETALIKMLLRAETFWQ